MRRAITVGAVALSPLLVFITTTVVWWRLDRYCALIGGLDNFDCFALSATSSGSPRWISTATIGAALGFAVFLVAALRWRRSAYLAAVFGFASLTIGAIVILGPVPDRLAEASTEGSVLLGPGPFAVAILGLAMILAGLALGIRPRRARS